LTYPAKNLPVSFTRKAYVWRAETVVFVLEGNLWTFDPADEQVDRASEID